MRPQEDNKPVGMGQIPSEIYKIFRTKWINILKNIFGEIYNKGMINSWEIGIIIYIKMGPKQSLSTSDRVPY